MTQNWISKQECFKNIRMWDQTYRAGNMYHRILQIVKCFSFLDLLSPTTNLQHVEWLWFPLLVWVLAMNGFCSFSPYPTKNNPIFPRYLVNVRTTYAFPTSTSIEDIHQNKHESLQVFPYFWHWITNDSGRVGDKFTFYPEGYQHKLTWIQPQILPFSSSHKQGNAK